MKNKLDRAVKSTNPLGPSSISMTGTSGVFGANPAPTFRDYPQTSGPDVIPVKFAETDITPEVSNKMDRATKTPGMAESVGIQLPGGSTIIRGRNHYDSATTRSTNPFRDKI